MADREVNREDVEREVEQKIAEWVRGNGLWAEGLAQRIESGAWRGGVSWFTGNLRKNFSGPQKVVILSVRCTLCGGSGTIGEGTTAGARNCPNCLGAGEVMGG